MLPGDSRKTKKLIEFDKRTVSTLTGILIKHRAIGKLRDKFSLPHQDYCRRCLDIEEIKSL